MHIFHKWIPLYKKDSASFLGENYEIDKEAGIRICKVCRKAQKCCMGVDCVYWKTLNPQELIILGKKIASNKIYKLEKDNEGKD